MEKQLSASLLARLQEALGHAEPPTMFWNPDQCLSPEQINKLLLLPDGLLQIEREIVEENEEYADQLSRELLCEILERFRQEITTELDLTEWELTSTVLDAIIEQHDLYAHTPGVDPNMYQLVRHSRPRPVLQLGLYHDYEGWNWRQHIQYKDVRQALRLFNVNPRKMHPKFPNLMYRNGHEFISPKDLLELWDNASYGGRYVMPIDLNLIEYQRNRDHYNTGIVLKKGAEIWMHNYSNGSGSISVPLQKDLTILRRKLVYHITDDNDTAGYGLDAVYGLCQSAWDNRISAVMTDNPAPYSLAPYQEVFQYFTYGSVYASWQSSTRIRAFDSPGFKRNDKSPAPGDLMNWDISHLWKAFPHAGIDFLHTKTDREADHLVFKIKETIGQASFVHCHFITHDPSREIVWSSVAQNDRSQSIFEFIRGKVQRTSPKSTPTERGKTIGHRG